MSKLVEGDRVEYVAGPFADKWRIGDRGIVSDVFAGSIEIRWDNGNGRSCHSDSYLKKVTDAPKVPPFKVGDRVKYTGKREYSNSSRIGMVGTVKDLKPGFSKPNVTMVVVDWDHDSKGYRAYPENLEKVEKVEVKTFKVGDKVRILKTNLPGHNVGDIGKVTHADSDPLDAIVKVEANGRTWWYVPANIEKVEEGSTVSYSGTRTNTPATPVIPPVSDLEDVIKGMRAQADKADEYADAYREFASKMNDTADALEAISDLATV